MKVGDKVTEVDVSSHYDDDNWAPRQIKIHCTYTIKKILEIFKTGGRLYISDTDFCTDNKNVLELAFEEIETRGYSFNINRFKPNIKEERKLKLQKIFKEYER